MARDRLAARAGPRAAGVERHGRALGARVRAAGARDGPQLLAGRLGVGREAAGGLDVGLLEVHLAVPSALPSTIFCAPVPSGRIFHRSVAPKPVAPLRSLLEPQTIHSPVGDQVG